MVGERAGRKKGKGRVPTSTAREGTEGSRWERKGKGMERGKIGEGREGEGLTMVPQPLTPSAAMVLPLTQHIIAPSVISDQLFSSFCADGRTHTDIVINNVGSALHCRRPLCKKPTSVASVVGGFESSPGLSAGAAGAAAGSCWTGSLLDLFRRAPILRRRTSNSTASDDDDDAEVDNYRATCRVVFSLMLNDLAHIRQQYDI